MNRLAHAYERALFPLRRRDAGEHNDLSDPLDVAVGAGWYRLVCAVEALIETLKRTASGRRLGRPQPTRRTRSGVAAAGCG